MQNRSQFRTNFKKIVLNISCMLFFFKKIPFILIFNVRTFKSNFLIIVASYCTKYFIFKLF